MTSPGWVQKAAAAFRRSGVGWLLTSAGLFFIIEGFADRAAKDVPSFVLVAAGVTFFVGGALAFLSAPGSEDSVLRRSLVALLITAFAATATVFPPSLLFMAPLTVLAWIAVVRLLVQNRTGRETRSRAGATSASSGSGAGLRPS